ncbi:thioesterase family protein [Noviherbaspirillum sp. Root189]|uniref:thioesterase family protein n=1 Tax=Noviherbaspirillum sp. Root189 TaxID=1736487 RepID=UPI00070F2AFF|nr:thioesterase family protein [Noviherbaspirillum sp. Root189]KRB93553.1 thioesterase [Noviherbaspirillum sp. Root189]
MLAPGISFTFTYAVPPSKTVPCLYPESDMFQQMPKVLATGFMVGLLEWACIESIKDHMDWPKVQSVGTGVYFTHQAATPPGLTVTVSTELVEVVGRRLLFKVSAHDGVDVISQGTHERYLIDPVRFNEKLKQKQERAADAD